MTVGILKQNFDFVLRGVELQGATRVNVRRLGLSAELIPGDPIGLSVEVTGTTEAAAEGHAGSLAQMLYCRLLLRFAGNIEDARRPRTVQRAFTSVGAAPSTVTAAATLSATAMINARATVALAHTEVEAVARDVEWRLTRRQPATSAQLCTAVDMYSAGLGTENGVVRFLIFYSALALAGLFKWHRGGQAEVDRLIKAINPGIATFPSSRKASGIETLWSKLRNDFVHAERRGCDPESAVRELETHIRAFQMDVAKVFQTL